jgi:hypothetical protein
LLRSAKLPIKNTLPPMRRDAKTPRKQNQKDHKSARAFERKSNSLLFCLSFLASWRLRVLAVTFYDATNDRHENEKPLKYSYLDGE